MESTSSKTSEQLHNDYQDLHSKRIGAESIVDELLRRAGNAFQNDADREAEILRDAARDLRKRCKQFAEEASAALDVYRAAEAKEEALPIAAPERDYSIIEADGPVPSPRRQ